MSGTRTTPRSSLLKVPAKAYHADELGTDQPCLSASMINLLLAKSPRHAWFAHPKLNPNFERKTEEKFDVGTAAHQLFLEGVDALAIIPFDDWRTSAAKELRDEARLAGRIPLLTPQAEDVYKLVDALRTKLRQRNDDPALFTDGQPEHTITWQEDGVWCKARLDYLNNAHTLISDLKTTKASANPEAWARTAYGMGADVQVAFYQRAVSSLHPERILPPEFRYVVVEVEAPYELAVFSLAPSALDLANAKIDKALAIWKRCLSTGAWPGYASEVAYIEAPGWAEAQWMAREMREEMAA